MYTSEEIDAVAKSMKDMFERGTHRKLSVFQMHLGDLYQLKKEGVVLKLLYVQLEDYVSISYAMNMFSKLVQRYGLAHVMHKAPYVLDRLSDSPVNLADRQETYKRQLKKVLPFDVTDEQVDDLFKLDVSISDLEAREFYIAFDLEDFIANAKKAL